MLSLRRSTHRLDELTVTLTDGATVPALRKHAPACEIAVYRSLLPGRDDVPRLLAEEDGALVLEDVPGTPLWQHRLPAWLDAARALGRWHTTADPTALREPGWWEACMGELLRAEPVVAVHGEAYPANILVRPDGRICLLDWETAAPGPAALDLAALVVGWPPATVDRLRDAYAATAPAPVGRRALAAARLCWAQRWQHDPAAGNAPSGTVDWTAEARDAEQELACGS